MIGSVLRLAKGMGFNINPSERLASMEPDDAYGWLTTGIEVMRMIRDGDSNTNDDRARSVYRELTS